MSLPDWQLSGGSILADGVGAVSREALVTAIHIVRDGVDVARSIERMAAVTRKMAFRPPLNEWWGWAT